MAKERGSITFHFNYFLASYLSAFFITLITLRFGDRSFLQQLSLGSNLDPHGHIEIDESNAVSLDEQQVFVSHKHEELGKCMD